MPTPALEEVNSHSPLSTTAQHVAFSLNQESFKFMLDPMLFEGAEKISAMGYGLAPNALTREEGGISRYFSQRFAQVTNPPLDSIRETDGMTLRVALGPKPNISPNSHKQIVLDSPILLPQQLLALEQQKQLQIRTLPMLFNVDLTGENEQTLLDALETLCAQAEQLAREHCDIIVLSDKEMSH